jgi:dihydropyrimidinase
MVDDGTLLKAMKVAGRHGGQISAHCENGHIIQMLVDEAVAAGNLAPRYHMLTRPPLAEGEATERVIRLAEVTGTPAYIVHLSARQSLEAVVEARQRGSPSTPRPVPTTFSSPPPPTTSPDSRARSTS